MVITLRGAASADLGERTGIGAVDFPGYRVICYTKNEKKGGRVLVHMSWVPCFDGRLGVVVGFGGLRGRGGGDFGVRDWGWKVVRTYDIPKDVHA